MNFFNLGTEVKLILQAVQQRNHRSRTNSLKSQAGTQKEVTASDPDWTTWGNLGDQALEVKSRR